MSDFGVRVTRSAEYTYTATAWEVVPFNVEVYDTDDIHSLVANTQRLTCQTPGRYFAHGAVEWDAPGAAEEKGIYIRQTTPSLVELGLVNTYGVPAANQQTAFISGGIFDLGVGDYLELYTYATIGSKIRVIADSSPIFGMQYLNAEESCRVRNNTNFNIASGSEVFPDFNVEGWDTDSMWNVGNPKRVTINTEGWYLLCVSISIGDLHAGYRRLSIRKNGSTYLARKTLDPNPGGTTGMTLIAIDRQAEIGDYYEVGILQDQGAVQEVKGLDAGWNGFSLSCSKLVYEDLSEYITDSDVEYLLDSDLEVLSDAGY